MGTTTEKLTYLQGTKDAIKNAIEAKGVAVPEGTTFRGYAEKVGEIPTGNQIETCEVVYNGAIFGLSAFVSFAMYDKNSDQYYTKAFYDSSYEELNEVIVGSKTVVYVILSSASDYVLTGGGGVVVTEKNKVTVNGSGTLELKAIGGPP